MRKELQQPPKTEEMMQINYERREAEWHYVGLTFIPTSIRNHWRYLRSGTPAVTGEFHWPFHRRCNWCVLCNERDDIISDALYYYCYTISIFYEYFNLPKKKNINLGPISISKGHKQIIANVRKQKKSPK